MGAWWSQRLPVCSALALVLVAGAPPKAPTGVVVPAGTGQPGDLPTYAGPDGTSIPVGACPEWVNGKVWVVPCSTTGAQAYRRPGRGQAGSGAAAAVAEATAAMWAALVVAGGLATLIRRRRGQGRR